MSVNGVNNVSVMTDAIKYVSGEKLTEEKLNLVDTAKEAVTSPITLAFGAMGVKSGLTDTFCSNKITPKASVSRLTGKTKVKLTDKISAGWQNFKNSISEAKEAVKGIDKSAKSITLKSGKELNISKNLGSQLKSSVERAVESADMKAAEKAAKAAESSGKTGIFSSIKSLFTKGKNAIKGTSVAKGASNLLKKIAPEGSKLAKAGKAFKGTGAVGFLIFDGILGLVTEVIPAFKQGGTEAGIKQIGKTGAKALANAGGWAVGSIVGGAVGAFVGSIFPGAGTIIGEKLGSFLGGMVGSAVCSATVGKMTGKSETEKVKDQQYEQAAVELSQDQASTQEMGQYVMAKVQEDIQSGNVTEDTEKMAKYLQMGAFGNLSAGVNQTGSAAISPAITAQTTPQSFQTAAQGYNQYQINPATTNPTNWTEVAQKINQGDTSIYNISDDKLNSLFTKPKKTKNEGNTSLSNLNQNQNPSQTTSDIMFKGNKDVVNYFA